MKTSDSVKTLAVIPARGGSKGIPGKNIADLCGHPLIYYTIREAHRSKLIDATIVSTDDKKIADVARELGADVPFLRPADIAKDDSRDIEFLKHTLDWVETNRGWKPEYIAYLLPTSPSRTAQDIDLAIALLHESGADSVRTMVYPPHFSPYKMWIESGPEGRVEPLFPTGRKALPRQELHRHLMPIGIAYAMKAECIRAGNLWGKDVRSIEFPLDRFTDIDYPEDMAHAADILRRNDLV